MAPAALVLGLDRVSTCDLTAGELRIVTHAIVLGHPILASLPSLRSLAFGSLEVGRHVGNIRFPVLACAGACVRPASITCEKRCVEHGSWWVKRRALLPAVQGATTAQPRGTHERGQSIVGLGGEPRASARADSPAPTHRRMARNRHTKTESALDSHAGGAA